MSVEETRTLMDAYFQAMGTGAFSGFYSADVTWTTVESGAVVSGPRAVEQAVIGLHANMIDLRTLRLVTADGAAYLEGSAERTSGPPGRIRYCVAYDIAGPRITAMRAFGALAALMPGTNTEANMRMSPP